MSQGKLKRTQEHDIDLEAGSSKKKLVTSHSGSQQESPGQPEIQQATGEKPSFRVIGHFVMAMKRFQGEQTCMQQCRQQNMTKLLPGQLSALSALLSTLFHDINRACDKDSVICLVSAASLNPTYTYGKVHEDSGASSTSSGDFVHPAQRILRVCTSLPLEVQYANDQQTAVFQTQPPLRKHQHIQRSTMHLDV